MLVVIVALVRPAPVAAIEEITSEEDISELLVEPPAEVHEQGGTERRAWAILPQLGYGPDTGPVIGAKYTHRDIFGTGTLFDLDGTYAVFNQQEHFAVKIGNPHLDDDRFLVTLWGKYRFDPQREFFGLGNNTRGPHPASTHGYQDFFGILTIGWRPVPRVAINFSAQFRDVDIRGGDRLNKDCGGFNPCPFTIDQFPDMPGVKGGKTNPLSLSFVYNGRDSNVRPTRGWRIIMKVSHTNRALLSDFEFTRLVGEAGYLYPFFNNRLVLGARAHGLIMDGPTGALPFWELADLGGDDTLRGFFPHRFLGEKRALLNLEARGLLTEFDFYDIWHVKLDGVLFGEGGRVFLPATEVENEFHAGRSDIQYVSHLQYSYGMGLRITLSEALVARLDAGFSTEEKALFYLTFGQTF